MAGFCGATARADRITHEELFPGAARFARAAAGALLAQGNGRFLSAWRSPATTDERLLEFMHGSPKAAAHVRQA